MPTHPTVMLALPPLHSLGPPMGGLASVYFCLFPCSVSSSPRAIKTKKSAFGVALVFSFNSFILVARYGGHSFSSAPALIFSLLSRVVGGSAFGGSANGNKHRNRPNSTILVNSTSNLGHKSIGPSPPCGPIGQNPPKWPIGF